MSWERDQWGGCECHHLTFCPDWKFVGYEDDVPIYYKKSDLERSENCKRDYNKIVSDGREPQYSSFVGEYNPSCENPPCLKDAVRLKALIDWLLENGYENLAESWKNTLGALGYLENSR